MTEPVRLVDLGAVPPVRSQSIYHALAYELTDEGPDTILLVTGDSPYVSIGFHQVAEKELDLDACRALGLRIVRREIGGGAVYLDANQLFTQWIFRGDRLPVHLEERFRFYSGPLVQTYRSLGVEAEYRPVNDIHVQGRKIGGTGAARIGGAEIVVGSLMFDFDHDAMARVLRVPSEKMRDKVATTLKEYVTTLRRELGAEPDRPAIVARYLEECSKALGRPVEPGEVTAAELARAEELDRRLASDEWTFRKHGRSPAGVKIHEDLHVYEGAHKAPGGLVRVTAVVRAGVIDDISISGDFTLLPQGAVATIEEGLAGTAAEAGAVAARVTALYQELGVEAPGLTPEDLGTAFAAALSPPEAAG